MRMKHLLLGASALVTAGALSASPSLAQQTAKVVTACGSAGYTAGSVNYQTIDTGGGQCPASSGSASIVQGNVSNGSDAVATTSTNVPNVSYNYGFNGATWDRLKTVPGVATTGVGVLAAGIVSVFNNTPPSFLTTQYGSVQMTADGSLRTFNVGTPTATKVGVTVNSILTGTITAGSGTAAPLAVSGFFSNGSAQDAAVSINGAVTAGTGDAAVVIAPTSAIQAGLTVTTTAAVASSQVLKGSAGNGYRYAITTGASAGFFMIFDATSAPADGAVTPKICRAVAANTSLEINHSPQPDLFTVGITEVFSTTGCFTKTASATAELEGSVQ